jgi:hypothetical protein
MSQNKTASKGAPGALGEFERTSLRVHDGISRALEPPRSTGSDPDRAGGLCLSSGLIGEFLDRRAGERLRHYLEGHASYAWKPRLALVLPQAFRAQRPSHLRDVSVALEVISAIIAHYNVDVVSDSPDAGIVSKSVVPFSQEAIAAYAGALVVLSRSLNDELSAIVPSRYVAADPCAYRMNKQRIVFTAGGAALPFVPAEESEIARDPHGCLSAFVDEDDGVDGFLESLARLRAREVPLHVTLSSRSDEAFVRRIHAFFAGDPRVEVREPELEEFAVASEFELSNEPIALLTGWNAARPRFLFNRGAYWRVGREGAPRSDFYLFRGEESNTERVLTYWLGHGSGEARPPARPATQAHEPLVSIVVPIYNRTVEIIRMAHSIYVQDYPWIEVVLVSNGSPPETIEAIRVAENYLMKRSFRVRILDLPRACGSATVPRDLGIRASSGELICVLDSDDWLEPGFFDFLRARLWCDRTLYYPRRIYHDHGRAMYAGFLFGDTSSEVGPLESVELVSSLRSRSNFMGNSGVCFARTLFERAGGIDHRLCYGEDYYLWIRCARAGGRAEETEGRANISVHPGNNELVVGDKSRLDWACELACRQELNSWL